MNNSKVPNQFPWIVVAVLAAHGVLAIFLFGGGEPNTKTRNATTAAAVSESTVATTSGIAPASNAPTSHPLGNPTPGHFGKSTNENFEPRFPKRIPLQSELTGIPPVKESPASDIFAMAGADLNAPESKKGSQPNRSDNLDDLLNLPSAVAAARPAPFSSNKKETLDEPATAQAQPEMGTRLRIIEKVEPVSVPVPHPIAVAPVETPRIEPVSAPPSNQPRLRFRAMPIVEESAAPKLKPVVRRQVEKVPPAQPTGDRKFRVIKPLAR